MYIPRIVAFQLPTSPSMTVSPTSSSPPVTLSPSTQIHSTDEVDATLYVIIGVSGAVVVVLIATAAIGIICLRIRWSKLRNKTDAVDISENVAYGTKMEMSCNIAYSMNKNEKEMSCNVAYSMNKNEMDMSCNVAYGTNKNDAYSMNKNEMDMSCNVAYGTNKNGMDVSCNVAYGMNKNEMDMSCNVAYGMNQNEMEMSGNVAYVAYGATKSASFQGEDTYDYISTTDGNDIIITSPNEAYATTNNGHTQAYGTITDLFLMETP